ncbi:hypothetical protein ABZ815_03350 [Nonomuraea sp. NPDC047529]|uniref:hypothetical protein n=1 Tax=Nonomuraea sp. NPDC047529 TaxID=3155623 RepID=UPI0034119C8D
MIKRSGIPDPKDTPVARMLRHLDEELRLFYGRLCLYGGTEIPEFSDDESEATHETVTVRLEAWDVEPPEPGPDWRAIEQTGFTAATGVVQMGVLDGNGGDFLIGPPWFEYGLTVHVHSVNMLRWVFRFWPIRDVFDPLVHMRPKEPAGAALEHRRVPVPVTEAGQWAAMRQDRFRSPQESVSWTAPAQDHLGADPIARKFSLLQQDPVSRALNPDHVPAFPASVDSDRNPGETYRMWRWETWTADGRPPDGHLRTGRIVHLRDVHEGRVLASGIVTVLHTEDGRRHVRDAEPHEAARVVRAEETWTE